MNIIKYKSCAKDYILCKTQALIGFTSVQLLKRSMARRGEKLFKAAPCIYTSRNSKTVTIEYII